MLQRQALFQVSCPIKLKVCHYTCYWHKKNKCTFPAEGYDARGHVYRKKKLTVNFNQLRYRLESERKHLIEELEQLEASVLQAGEQRQGDPFGKRDEGALWKALSWTSAWPCRSKQFTV